MRIAFVTDVIYPYVKGGAEKRVHELSRRLVKKGHEVHVFGMRWWDSPEVVEDDGVILHGVCDPEDLYVNEKRSVKEALLFAFRVTPHLSKENFDIIDCSQFPYFPCFAAKIASVKKNCPLIITWHEVWGDYWYEYLGYKGFLGKTVERLVAKLPDRIIAVSERTKKDLEGIGVRKEIKVIPNGIDIGKIGRIKASEEESDIIFAGRLIREKNVDVLIKAVSRVREEFSDIRCVIIGDGPEKTKLEKLVLDLGMRDNIELTGFLEDYDDVISYMKSSKVFVLPSTREGFGIVALEANACGLPVVTVNHGRNAACDFITNDENGFICELSEGDVAEKILKGLDERENIKRKCIESAKGYDWDGMVNLIERVYKEKEGRYN